MPTTVTKTIKPGGGGNYSSIDAAESANRQNLVTNDRILVFEVYSGGNACTTIVQIAGSDGWTSDSTHYIQINPAVGEGHEGVYTTSKAYWSSNIYAMKTDQQVKVIGMQWTSTGDDFTITWLSPGSTKTVLFDSCIVLNPTGGSTNALFYLAAGLGDGTGTVIVRNCIGISRKSGGKFARSNAPGTIYVYNCTVRGSHGLSVDDGAIISQNNYLSCTTQTYGGAVTKGDHDATSSTDAITASLRSIAYSTANFINVTVDSENLHLASTSALKAKGYNLFANGVTRDIDNDQRKADVFFDIGADQVTRTSGGALMLATH